MLREQVRIWILNRREPVHYLLNLSDFELRGEEERQLLAYSLEVLLSPCNVSDVLVLLRTEVDQRPMHRMPHYDIPSDKMHFERD